jgi:hypothetical protein
MSQRSNARQFELPRSAFIRRPAGTPAPEPANSFDREMAQREQRALGLAAMGLVNRLGDRWVVAPAISRNRTANCEVWRDHAGSWRCSCSEFGARISVDGNFCCEHILAVKHAARSQKSETTPARMNLSMVLATEALDGVASGGGQLYAGDPCARIFGDLITPRQLGMIRQLARECSVNAEDQCRQLLGCAAGDLSRGAASALIEHLAALPRHTGEAQMPMAS